MKSKVYIIALGCEIDQVCTTLRECQRRKLDLIRKGRAPSIVRTPAALVEDAIYLIECGTHLCD